MMGIELSIIVSTHNSAGTIKRCLDSLIRQAILSYEIIIVDDASVDETVLIVDEYKKIFNSMLIIKKERNEGTFLSRIDGMGAASGKYLVFVDADDFINDYSNALIEAQKRSIDMLEFGYNLLDKNDRILSNREQELYFAIERKELKGKKVFNYFITNQRRIPVQLTLRMYSQNLYKAVYNEIKKVKEFQNKFKYILNEDEFLTPIFFANANSFFYYKEKVYNYYFLSEGGTMYSRRVNFERGMKGAREYTAACIFLSKYLYNKKLINKKQIFIYNINAISFLIYTSRQWNIGIINTVSLVWNFYSLLEIFKIWRGKWKE